MKWLVIFALAVACSAQTQGNLPGPIHANTGYDSNAACTHTTNCVNITENVQIGNEVVGCILWGNAGSAPTVTDALGNSVTQEAAYTFGSTGNDRPFHLQMYHFNSSFAGADYIILTGGSDLYGKPPGVFTGVSDTKDGSLVTNNATPSSPMGSVTNSVTSAVNGDIAISCMANTQGGSSVLSVGNGGLVSSDNANPPNAALSYQNLGLLGGYSITGSLYNSNGSDTVGIVTALFKPSTTIFLADTSPLPQAADGVAYKALLHVVGGISGTLTYACSGLPSNGLSLNTSTGVISGATPTGTGTLSLGCTVSDGTNTSATDTLSLQVGASFGSIALGSSVSGGFPGGGGSLPALSVSCGDMAILCTTQGDDTHGSSGWIQALSGSANKYSDSFGSTVQRFPMFGGTRNGPSSCVAFGPITSSGSDVITVVNNQGAASGLTAWAVPVHNAQGVVDVGSYTNALTSTSNPTASTSYTTLVPNEEAITAATIACGTGGCSYSGSDSVSFGAPFTTAFTDAGGSFAMSGFGTAAVASASSVTSTATFNGVTPTNGNDDSVMLIALRPALPFSGCVAPTLPGEKFKKVAY